jgi:hypothetical protein
MISRPNVSRISYLDLDIFCLALGTNVVEELFFFVKLLSQVARWLYRKKKSR